MPSHQTLASYLPESMLIKLAPAVSLLDDAGNLVGFRDALAFSYFFHEYVHYLHNISTVTSLRPEARVTGTQSEILTTIVCDAELSDGSNTERCVIRLGTLELLESAAWLLERRVAKAVDASLSVDPPPIIPYRVVEAAIEHAAPGLSEEAVICCVLSALQSSDAPDGMMQIIGIATDAIRNGRDPGLGPQRHS